MKFPRIRIAGILIKDKKILFIKHRKDNNEYWLLPGGGLDYGETFQEGLKREFIEETNLIVKVKDMAFISESIAPDLKRHIVNIYFIVEYERGILRVGEEDILQEVKYLSKEDIMESTIYPNIKEELVKLLDDEKGCIKYLGNRWE